MRVLGVPVGTTEYKARFCHRVVKALAADLATLRRVPSLQAQHVILTKSLMHRVTNLLRAIPGNSLAFKDAAELYDSELTTYSNRVFAVIVARRLLLPTQQPLGDSESLQCQYCHKTTHGMGCRCRYDAPDIYGDHAFSCTRGRGERAK